MKSKIFSVFLMLFPLGAYAGEENNKIEEIKGIAKVLGSSYNRHLVIKTTDQTTRICHSAMSQKIAKLTSYEVHVKGVFAKETGEQQCLKAQEFKVLTTSSGRPAVTGVLKRQGSQFSIEDAQGKVIPVTRLSKGLKKLEGKKVVVDLKQIKQQKGRAKVVSYMEHP